MAYAFFAIYPFYACQKPSQVYLDAKKVILVVEVKVSSLIENKFQATNAGFIIFYNDYSYNTEIGDESLRMRISSVFGRIIAEGRAHAAEYRTGRPGLSGYARGVFINDRHFIYAMVETAEQRLNNSGGEAHVYFTYK